MKDYFMGALVSGIAITVFAAIWELASSLPKIAANTKRIADALEKLVEQARKP